MSTGPKTPEIPDPEMPEYDLDELVAAITLENRHEEIDFGPPVGKELG